MFTYGIAETGKRHTIKPTRARVMLARVERWLDSTQGATVFFTVLTCALTTLIALAITQERASFVMTLFSILSVFAILATIGAMLVSDETSKRTTKQWRAIFAREYNAQAKEKLALSQELEREIIARKELSALLARVERDAQLERENLEHNLSAYKRDLASNRQNYSRALETVNELRELIASYESQLRELAGALFDAKVDSGDIDFTNYGKDID